MNTEFHVEEILFVIKISLFLSRPFIDFFDNFEVLQYSPNVFFCTIKYYYDLQ